MKYYTKVTIKSLAEYITPHDSDKCGTLIQNFYNAINGTYAKFSNIKMDVVRHNHHKAVLFFYCDDMADFAAFKEDFYRHYANRFVWRGGNKLWLVK